MSLGGLQQIGYGIGWDPMVAREIRVIDRCSSGMMVKVARLGVRGMWDLEFGCRNFLFYCRLCDLWFIWS